MTIYLRKFGIVATAAAINVYIFSLSPRNFPVELVIHSIALIAIQGGLLRLLLWKSTRRI